jgi:hypothetical protein
MKFKDVFEMEILIEPAASRYQNRRVGCEQLDHGIGCNPSAAEAALKLALSGAAEAAPFQNQGQAVGRHHGS